MTDAPILTFFFQGRRYMPPKARDIPPPGFADPTSPNEVTNAIDLQTHPKAEKTQLGSKGTWRQGPEGTKSNKEPGGDKPHLSAFAEPSEPSQDAPGEHSQDQLTNPQEENPQVIAKRYPQHKVKL